MNTALDFLGYKNTDTVKNHANNNPGIASMLIFVFVLFFFYGIVYCYGAAKLSYNYNTSIGNDWAFFWAVICYFFAGIYYPYYAIFLNPVSATGFMTGGRKRTAK
jgi:hypothetical protein